MHLGIFRNIYLPIIVHLCLHPVLGIYLDRLQYTVLIFVTSVSVSMKTETIILAYIKDELFNYTKILDSEV